MSDPSPRQRLQEWSRALPAIWRAADAARSRYREDMADWPPCVFLPLETAGEATLAAIDAKGDRRPSGPAELSPAAITTQGLAAWRMTQGIYRIDPTLYAALIDTPVTGDIPADVLLYMPEWCVYIETPGMTTPTIDGGSVAVSGLWYWLDAAAGRGMILCIGVDLGRRPPLTVQHVPLVGTIDAAIDATISEWSDAYSRGNAARLPPAGYTNAARAWLPPALSLILYLCSTSSNITGRSGRPGNPQPNSTRRHGHRLYAAEGPRQWDVGVRLGAALRGAMSSAETHDAGGEHHGVRPHIRRAHWHTFLLGPRNAGERKRDLRWMPPIPIAVEDYDALPSVIRTIGREK